jgi:PST family polysaccharide transporter
MTKSEQSYGQILKSSSIIGGSQGINYVVGMLRTKLVAMLLGTYGVGLVGLYIAATNLVASLTGLGLGSSGVREVAEAHSSGDTAGLARTVTTLRRACWVTGLIGWIATLALAYPLSLWTFKPEERSPERTTAIALLGITVLFGAVSGGQTALLQGTRRIGDLARINVLGVVAGTVIAVALYAWLGERGIVPVLIVTAAVNLGFSWWFSRKVPVAPQPMRWKDTWRDSKRLLQIGVAFMFSGLFTAAAALGIRAVIVRDLGIDDNGIYQGAWGISGMFAGFVLNAMGTDFFPRLTAAANDNAQVNRLVNEQTEIGVLLALPGLLATLAFAPWAMRFFLTAKFVPGAELLPWFVLGVFGQVISWPMGFTLAAKGAARWYVLVELTANVLRLGFSVVLLRWVGLWGTALAIPLLYLVHTLLLLWICHRLTRFRWSPGALKLLLISAVLVVAGFAAQKWVPGYRGMAVGAVLTTMACLLSMRGIVFRLGPNHRLVQMASKIPGFRTLCGL